MPDKWLEAAQAWLGEPSKRCAAVLRSRVLKMKGQTFRSSTITSYNRNHVVGHIIHRKCGRCSRAFQGPYSGVRLLSGTAYRSYLGVVLLTSSSLFKRINERANGDTKLLDNAMKKALIRTPCQDRTYTRPRALRPGVTGIPKGFAIPPTLYQRRQKDTYIAVDHLIQCRP